MPRVSNSVKCFESWCREKWRKERHSGNLNLTWRQTSQLWHPTLRRDKNNVVSVEVSGFLLSLSGVRARCSMYRIVKVRKCNWITVLGVKIELSHLFFQFTSNQAVWQRHGRFLGCCLIVFTSQHFVQQRMTTGKIQRECHFGMKTEISLLTSNSQRDTDQPRALSVGRIACRLCQMFNVMQLDGREVSVEISCWSYDGDLASGCFVCDHLVSDILAVTHRDCLYFFMVYTC